MSIKRMQMNNQVKWFRFFLSVLVIWIHAVNAEWFPALTELENICELHIRDYFAAAGVPGFFLLSGYFFFAGFPGQEAAVSEKGTKEIFLRKFRNRIYTIVIPYLVWNTIYYAVNIICRKLPFLSGMFDTTEIGISVREILQAVLFYHWNPVFWFMLYLIIYILLTPLIYIMMRTKKQAIVFAIIITLASSLQLLEHFSLVAANLLQWFVFFVFGAYLSMYGKRLIERDVSGSGLLIASGIVFGTMVFLAEQFPGVLLVFQILRMAEIIFIWGLVSRIKLPEPGLLQNNTFLIYAAHHLIVHLFNAGTGFFFGNVRYLGFVLYLILPAIVLAICTVLCRLAVRFLPDTCWVFGIRSRNI